MSLITALELIKHDIPLSAAVEMTKRFQDEQENILKREYAGKDILPLCETFHRSAFEDILGQKNCVGVRAYFGMNKDKKVNLIFVGVNDKNEDILPSSKAELSASTAENAADDPGGIKQEGQRCPPICPPRSPLIQ